MIRIAASRLALPALLALATLLAPALPARTEVAASAPVTVEIVEHGEYEPRGETPKTRAPDTSLGYVQTVEATDDPVLLTWTEVVEARLGSRFGIKILVPGEPSFDTVRLRIRVLHPPFRNPGSGRSSESEEWDARVNVGIPRFTGWTFDEAWEMVPGRWTMQVLDGDRVVAEQEFEIVAALSGEDAGDLSGWRPAQGLEGMPDELWERASVIVSGRYREGRSPCIWLSEDERVWVRTTGFEITRRYLGPVRSDYIEVALAASRPDSYVCADCLVPGREYLLLLRPSPASMELLGTREGGAWFDTLGDAEILAIVEIPAGPGELAPRLRNRWLEPPE